MYDHANTGVCFFKKYSPCPDDRFQKAELHKDSKNSEGSGTKSLALKVLKINGQALLEVGFPELLDGV